jgi:YidC/Oxa1 family membrane protein insertase
MMQTMMNFMPIMVVIFGWTFAAGPVLYWATQSAYSVVQQWFITGWGAMKDWLPWLPDLPEHRRLGHRKEPLQSFAGEGGEVQPTGFMARLQARTQDLEERQREREQQRGGQTGGQTPSRSRSKSSTKAQSQTQQQKSRANARAQQQQAARDEPEEQPQAGGPRIVRARQNAGGDGFDGNGAGGKRARRTRGQASVGDVSGASLDADIDASGQTRPSRRTKK